MKRWLAGIFFAAAVLAFGSDWLSLRGDPQNSGWQRGEKTLSVHSVGSLRLLWQRKLSDTPDSLTDPVILGPIITQLGIKELVFVQNVAGTVYAIDADLGRTFWHRALGSASACSGGRPVQPAMKPAPNSNTLDGLNSDEDNFSDGNRPLYTITADGEVFPLRPSTGGNLSASFHFLPPGLFPAQMEALGNVLEAATSKTCDGVANASWSIPVNATGAPTGRAAPTGTGTAALPVEFTWDWKTWQATIDRNGRPQVLSDGDTRQHLLRPIKELATWEDEDANRRIYTATQNQIAAFRVRKGSPGKPVVTSSWRLSNLIDPGAPFVANGVVYFLAKAKGNGTLVLHAVAAETGENLYTSKDLISSRASSGNLAIANGHVCFSTTDSQTYCFGSVRPTT